MYRRVGSFGVGVDSFVAWIVVLVFALIVAVVAVAWVFADCYHSSGTSPAIESTFIFSPIVSVSAVSSKLCIAVNLCRASDY